MPATNETQTHFDTMKKFIEENFPNVSNKQRLITVMNDFFIQNNLSLIEYTGLFETLILSTISSIIVADVFHEELANPKLSSLLKDILYLEAKERGLYNNQPREISIIDFLNENKAIPHDHLLTTKDVEILFRYLTNTGVNYTTPISLTEDHGSLLLATLLDHRDNPGKLLIPTNVNADHWVLFIRYQEGQKTILKCWDSLSAPAAPRVRTIKSMTTNILNAYDGAIQFIYEYALEQDDYYSCGHRVARKAFLEAGLENNLTQVPVDNSALMQFTVVTLISQLVNSTFTKSVDHNGKESLTEDSKEIIENIVTLFLENKTNQNATKEVIQLTREQYATLITAASLLDHEQFGKPATSMTNKKFFSLFGITDRHFQIKEENKNFIIEADSITPLERHMFEKITKHDLVSFYQTKIDSCKKSSEIAKILQASAEIIYHTNQNTNAQWQYLNYFYKGFSFTTSSPEAIRIAPKLQQSGFVIKGTNDKQQDQLCLTITNEQLDRLDLKQLQQISETLQQPSPSKTILDSNLLVSLNSDQLAVFKLAAELFHYQTPNKPSASLLSTFGNDTGCMMMNPKTNISYLVFKELTPEEKSFLLILTNSENKEFFESRLIVCKKAHEIAKALQGTFEIVYKTQNNSPREKLLAEYKLVRFIDFSVARVYIKNFYSSSSLTLEKLTNRGFKPERTQPGTCYPNILSIKIAHLFNLDMQDFRKSFYKELFEDTAKNNAQRKADEAQTTVTYSEDNDHWVHFRIDSTIDTHRNLFRLLHNMEGADPILDDKGIKVKTSCLLNPVVQKDKENLESLYNYIKEKHDQIIKQQRSETFPDGTIGYREKHWLMNVEGAFRNNSLTKVRSILNGLKLADLEQAVQYVSILDNGVAPEVFPSKVMQPL